MNFEDNKMETPIGKSEDINEGELNNIEEGQDKENTVTGKELEGRVMAGIGTVDIDIYKDYCEKNGIGYKIYTYKNNTELSLLVVGTPVLQKQIFNELVSNNEKIKGGFWSDSTVKEETELELVHGNNKGNNEVKEEFTEGDVIELTTEKIEQLKEKDLLIGFPHTSGEISSVSGNMASVDFGGSVRLVNLKDIKKV